jgi:hypothetical protein
MDYDYDIGNKQRYGSIGRTNAGFGTRESRVSPRARRYLCCHGVSTWDSDAVLCLIPLHDKLCNKWKHVKFSFGIGSCGIRCVGSSFSRIRGSSASYSRFKDGLADGQSKG